jgi:hypothetical protein
LRRRLRWGDPPATISTGLAAVAIVLLLAAPSARAGNQYVIFGAGGRPCGSWLQMRTQALPENAVLQSWVLGYITSANANLLSVTRDVSGGASPESLFGWIDNYCTTHPLDSLARATRALLDSLIVKNKAQ